MTDNAQNAKKKMQQQKSHTPARKRIRPARARITASLIMTISTKARRESPAAASIQYPILRMVNK